VKTISETVLVACALTVTACVLLLSIYLIAANVGHPWTYGVALLVMCVAWIVRRFACGSRDVTASIVAAGVLLTVALAAKALEHLGVAVGNDIGARTTGVICGALIVVISNAIPKKQLNSASGLAAKRSVGTALVLGGLGYAFAWLVLPIGIASTVAMIVLFAGVAVGAVSVVRWHRT
jgi:hypothetical protein